MTDPYAWHSVADMVERDSLERIKALYPPVVVQADLAEIQGWLDRAQADEFFVGYVREMSSLPPRRPWWRRLNDWLRGRS